ncbi:hypothetical protein HW453_04015 [Treponema phagedenis]|nr:hypothetical protein HW453_04015 [Treponema phagedenis]
MVPYSSDVLKQKYLQSFKTRRFGFTTDGKIRTGTDARGSKQKRCLKASTLFCKIEAFKLARYNFAKDVKIRTATDGSGSKQKRCLKASTLFCKIEAFKLAGLVLTWTSKPCLSIPMVNCSPLRRVELRTATDGSGSKQKRSFKSTNFF